MALTTGVAAGLLAEPAIRAQSSNPTARLVAAPTVRMSGDVDSNSPAIWDLVDGRNVLHVLTSTAGQTSLASGANVARLGRPAAVGFHPHPGHGVWIESVITDGVGTWYGYYHNEIPADVCDRPERTIPRIGAARSRDQGRSWEDLGIILEAPSGQMACHSSNQYFLGGVGDFSAVLDADATTLYLFFSQYSPGANQQGVAVGRMLWAHRDQPVGRVDVWNRGTWLPPQPVFDEVDEAIIGWDHPFGTPLVDPSLPWHDAGGRTDAFWGPSIHWNAHLEQYVMLLNRAKDEHWAQEGIYVSFSPVLDDPLRWSAPQRILDGGGWYPQVIGLEPAAGTDKQAGARARFFMGGTSSYFIDFVK
ncbi:MAG: sialidase family protein [Acidobacteriota bacterium]|nr:sialidase family protein [Acidobacteriota bacterium]